MTKAPKTPGRVVRCAVYTRKSTEEGLDQEFNSLHAQRESAEAYIKSQKQTGWICLPEHYDDGGFTGGNLDRPALQRLLQEIDRGQIDCVVVYKVDRLSRSLLDFAKIMEAFEKRQVAFVSVTQMFNTATSMGRLVLNVLLSFAQFEREIISERTRDKIAAARRKGKWVGGQPLLGYDIQNSKLVVNEEEAVQVRAIFDLYLKYQGLIPVVQELERRDWRTKRWQTRKGLLRGGQRFAKSSLHHLLTNPVYVGKVKYKNELHAGEHQAVIPADIWHQVQDLLHDHGPGVCTRTESHALLKGILRCRPCGFAMTPGYATKNGGKRYRFYACVNALKRGRHVCPSRYVPAVTIESTVIDQIRELAKRLPVLSGAKDALAPFQEPATWERLSSAEQARLVQHWVQRVEYDGQEDKVTLTFHSHANPKETRE
jgi:site-specific DNA recombinase